MVQDIMMLLFAWLLTGVWQYTAAPWLLLLLKRHAPDAGWGFGRLVGWLTISLIVWFLAHFGLAVNQPAFIWIVTLSLAVLAHRVWRARSDELLPLLQQKKSIILWEEALFLFGFIALAFIRSFHPQILDLEKFMDAGLMVSYARSPVLPLEDMWLAGEKMNYYTFGHFMGALASQFWSISVPVSYNLLLGLIAGLLVMQVFSLVATLVAATNQKATLKALIASGLVGVLLVAIGGNGHAVWYLIKNSGFKGYWYPDATRFIDRTIHEFPSYSFIVSDLHAHVWSLPIVLLAIVAIGYWLVELYKEARPKKPRYWWQMAVVVGILLGVLVMTSSWDAAIYSLLLGVIGVLTLIVYRQAFVRLFLSALLIIITMLATSSMWWLNFDSISEGVRIAHEQSPLWQLVVLWGPHVATSMIALVIAIGLLLRSKKINSWLILLIGLVISAFCLLVLPELIFVKDIYPNHPRANTMFKLTFQAFTIMGIVIAWLAGWVQSAQVSARIAWPIRVWLLLVLCGVLLYPYFGYRDYYNRMTNYQGLDGTQWLAEQHPDDFAAIEWLNNTVKGRPVVVEAVGESYTTFARVSTFTGLPTVLGWRVHEWLWRGGFEIPGKRTEEVKRIYEEPKASDSTTILNQYQVRFIFVGDKEREAYTAIDEAGLKSLGRMVFQSGETYIIDRAVW
jgi:uncharacterized membrane protein